MKHCFRRNLIEALLTIKESPIDLDQLPSFLDVDRMKVRFEMGYLVRRGAAIVINRRDYSEDLSGKRGRKYQKIIYALNRPKLLELFEKTHNPLSGWEKMWRVIRAFKRFTRNDLCELAGVSGNNARTYTQRLRKRGYIRYRANGIWEIITDPGPKRPA